MSRTSWFRSETSGKRRGLAAGVATTLTAMTLALLPAVAATAAPAYEITGGWAEGTPAQVDPGDVVTAEWRINVNDDQPAPSNDPVDNVTLTASAGGGTFRALPDLCLIDGVDPVSSIAADGLTLVCNTGTQQMGTAVFIQTPVVVGDASAGQLTLIGDINGQTAEPEPLPITPAPFGMDMTWSGPSGFTQPSSATTIDMEFQWTLNLLAGSEPGPDSIQVRLLLSNNFATESKALSCDPYTRSFPFSEHPWSGGDNPEDRMAPFADSCTIAPGLFPGVYWMTLTGIDYSLTQVPTRDAAYNLLPVDRQAVASGSITVRTPRPASTLSVDLSMDPPTYTSPTGATSLDEPSNNTANSTWTPSGGWSSAWLRSYTKSGGSNWDDTYRVSPGTQLASSNHFAGARSLAPATVVEQCQALDTRYVTFDNARFSVPGVPSQPNATFYYYVGNDPLVTNGSGQYNPYSFIDNCNRDAANWTTTLPADLSTIKAVRTKMTALDITNWGRDSILVTLQRVNDDALVGADIWSFASFRVGESGAWQFADNGVTQTPGLRYPNTTGSRDLVRVVGVTPQIAKSVDRSVLPVAGQATYTLEYSLTGSGAVPDTVDGVQLVDTLPVELTYAPGSANPEPVVTMNAGRQVLTWTLDDVPTNTLLPLSYGVVLSPTATPGVALSNSVTASYGEVTTNPAVAQVTTSTNGVTTIGKTADVGFIPNVSGDGVGDGSWTVTLRSYDPLPQAFTDTIDILPYVGDERGTAFSGTYALTGVEAVAGATVYYTDADPTTLSDDPADGSNGASGDTAGNTVGWTTTVPAVVTAVRVIGPALTPGATQAFTLSIATEGVTGGDVLVNRAQARTEHTELVMRTSAPISVANYYSASLKKYVQDAEGVWRDANTVEDYPTYRVGDTVPYRIVIENTGQGTLTNLVITDDLFPAGSFTVLELAPGAVETHEFDIVLDAAMGDSMVNTACAAADIPSDSEVPPTINCDPAGIEVDGEPTHTKSLISATQIGGGQWEVVYGLEVTNTSTAATSYSLDDELHFTDQATIVSASVTSAPAGVTLEVPAWNGQGNLDIATDVPLAGNDDPGYAPHQYVLTVVADVPLQLAGAGEVPDPTQCGADGDDSNTAFNNVSTLTNSSGVSEDDQACAPIPSIDIDKSVSAGPTPNEDGTWTVTYDVVATNTGHADGAYDVTDRMTADGDLEVVSGAVIAAPSGVTPSESWTGLGAEGAQENVIATGVVLPAGGTHTYQVAVVIAIAGGAGGAPVITDCSAQGEGETGGLSNAAGVEHNDLTDEATACVTVGYVTVDKSVSAGPTPNGNGTWTVVYDIVAENVGADAADYDVTDRLHFGGDIEIVSAGVITTPEGVDALESWTGLGAEDSDEENLVAEGVSLDAGGVHTYQVEVIVQLDEITIDPESLRCPPGGSGENGGLANSTTLTHNGITAEDDVCPTLPLITIDKELIEGSPVPNGDRTWTVAYDLVVTNDGQAAGEYDLADQLQYGDGIVVGTAGIVSAPAGVETNPDWTGQGTEGSDENVVANGVTLDAGASHTFRVEVVVSLDQAVVTPDTLECPAPGEPGGLANTATLTHNGENQDDAACAPLPLIEITKSLAGGVVPVDGQVGVYDVSYEVLVTNSGPAAGVYDLDDALAPGAGVEVVGIQSVTTDAPEPVGLNAAYNGVDDIRIVTGQPIAGAAGTSVVHTYLVTVRFTTDLAGLEVPVGNECTTADGTVAGALNNVATVSWNGIDDSDDECLRPGKPTLDKALVSANPVGKGQWEVVYDLTVGNVGTEPTTYDLDDELLFAPVVTVDSVSVNGPEGVELDSAFDGDANQRIATDVSIAGLDDAGYASHVYRVSVIANVPLAFDFDDVGQDGTGSPDCTTAPGSNLVKQGLNNAATLTDENDGTITDTDCAPLPSIDIEKTITAGPVVDGDRYTTTYQIEVTNTGGATGVYELYDQLRYGTGMDVVGVTASNTAPGDVAVLDTFTGMGGNQNAPENAVTAEVSLADGSTHTFQVVVVAELNTAAATAQAGACPTGAGDRGGLLNVAAVSHNGLSDDSAACAPFTTPDAPLAHTGVDIGWATLFTALVLLLGGGGAVLISRRNRATHPLGSRADTTL